MKIGVIYQKLIYDQLKYKEIIDFISFYEKNVSLDDFPWNILCRTQEIDINLYSNYENYFDINDIIEYQDFLNDYIIRKYCDDIDWQLLSVLYGKFQNVTAM